MALAIWADSPDVPATVCFDARLHGAGGSADDYSGQAGWDAGIHFSSLRDLASKLSAGGTKLPAHVCGNAWFNCAPAGAGQVTRLAINAHGLPGQLYVNGQNATPLTAANINDYVSDLKCIGFALAPEATVILMGCIAGQGPGGTLLLQALQKVWPGRTIVAFVTVGFQNPDKMYRSGQGCTEPGMRDTISLFPTMTGRQAFATYDPLWTDFRYLPWAAENSPGAKVIRNGVIVTQPSFDLTK